MHVAWCEDTLILVSVNDSPNNKLKLFDDTTCVPCERCGFTGMSPIPIAYKEKLSIFLIQTR